jgi:hypothetical protein
MPLQRDTDQDLLAAQEPLLEFWQDAEVIDEIEAGDESLYEGLTISHKEWTVQTIADQVRRGNIDLDPPYQRRSVWADRRRSLLIDSLIVGLPVPEIVLAEIPKQKGRYAVIDGKQRLQTIVGFLFPNEYQHFWSKPKLSFTSSSAAPSERGILRKQLQGKTYKDLSNEHKASLENASIRCTFLTNYRDEVVLYTLFHRLNSQSVALNMQELRQSLYHGPFSKFIVEATNQPGPLHEAMGLAKADSRLRDTELLLRYIAMCLFASEYKGNLRRFLDAAMDRLNELWATYENSIRSTHENMIRGIELAAMVLGGMDRVGRRLSKTGFDRRFNKVLFEVQVYYFARLDMDFISADQVRAFLQGFEALLQDARFAQAIGDTTKGLNEYRVRYTAMQWLFTQAFGVTIENPFPES